MPDPKTTKTRASVGKFLSAIEDPARRRDAREIVAMLRRVTGERPALWGPNIVGFGEYHYRYPSGRVGDTMIVGFAPRSDRLTLYLTSGFARHVALLARLGKHSRGKACLHVRRLADVDLGVLEELLRRSVAEVRAPDRR